VFGRAPRGSGALGRAGERVAARWLRRRRHRVLRRNFDSGAGEADLVCLAPDGETLVIVEVKTRRARDRGGGDGAGFAPEVAVGAAKERRLRTTAHACARKLGMQGRPLRIDVVSVVWPVRGRPAVTHHVSAVRER